MQEYIYENKCIILFYYYFMMKNLLWNEPIQSEIGKKLIINKERLLTAKRSRCQTWHGFGRGSTIAIVGIHRSFLLFGRFGGCSSVLPVVVVPIVSSWWGLGCWPLGLGTHAQKLKKKILKQSFKHLGLCPKCSCGLCTMLCPKVHLLRRYDYQKG